MDLYTLLHKISKIITPNTDYFYEYALHTFDDNYGFLRTRYCWLDNCLKNRNLRKFEYYRVFVSSETLIGENDFKPLNNLDNVTIRL